MNAAAPDDGRIQPSGWVRPPSDDRPLVTSRNNCDPSPWTGPFRVPRTYVNACGQGTLALYYNGGKVVFGALTCGSWSCPSCRKRLAARTLDRLRTGMEARPDLHRVFATLTIDPSKFGAYRIGSQLWPDGRETNLWSEPTPAQFAKAATSMSQEWKKLNDRLKRKCARAGSEGFGYFRVIELHRNGWPHYHVVLEHSHFVAADILQQLEGWQLGRVHAKDVAIDDAIGEVAPYLVCAERKSGGHKAYQFAASALPKNFRLWSASQGFLGAVPSIEGEKPEHGIAIRGHFATHHQSVREMGGTSKLVLNPPSREEHRPPSRSLATGDVAVLYFAELVLARSLHIKAVPRLACIPATADDIERSAPSGA